MYSLVIHLHPELGKMAQLMAELKQRNDISNSQGLPHMVVQQLFAPEPSVLTVTQFADLEAFEAWNTDNGDDESFAAAAQRISSTLTRPADPEMHESLAQSERSGEVNYFLAARAFSAPGKAGELRQAMEQIFSSKPGNPDGTVMRVLQREIVPEDGGNLTQNFGFESLKGLDKLMHEPSLGAGSRTLGDLLSRPVRQRLYRVLMPFQRP